MVAKLCDLKTLAMPQQITINDLTEFIIKHRGTGKAFRDWTTDQIRLHLLHYYMHLGLGVVRDEKTGEITGIVTGDVWSDCKVFHVQNILTIKDAGSSIQLLLQLFKKKYPEFKLTARRRGKNIKYDTERLLRKFSI